MIDGDLTLARRASQRGHVVQSPEGGPGIPPQNQAALSSVQPRYAGAPYGSSSPDMPPSPPVRDRTKPQDPGFRPPPAQPFGAPGSLVSEAYRQHLGREASAQELQDQFLGGRRLDTQHVQNVLASIRNSQEARDYQARQAAAAAAPPLQVPPPLGTAYDTPLPGWNTGGFAAPRYTANVTGGPLEGFDATKWADPLHQTPKYVVGRILASNPNTPEGRQAAIEQIMQAYPGTQVVDADEVLIPGVGLVDLWVGADAGLWKPSFQTGGGSVNTPGVEGGNTGLPFPFLNGPTPLDPLQGGNFTGQLLQYLAQQLGLQKALGGA